MKHEITPTTEGRFSLSIDGETVGTYSRRRDAVRRLRTLEAQAAGREDAPTDSREAAGGAAARPPASNTGGTDCAGQVSETYSHHVMVRGKLKEIPLRRGVSTCAHIDTLTLTFRETVFCKEVEKHTEESKAELAAAISATVHSLMGFGIYEERNGINGYKYSYRMGTDTANYGIVAFGGTNQQGTVMIYFFGDGLTAARNGWETRLYNWLTAFAPYARITRCDLAHDFLAGEYTPDQAYEDWKADGYTAHYRRPRARQHGYDWLDDERTGKTFYIGTPQSSRLLRVYDKGCEQGDNQSPWVRLELQLRNRDIIIPHDILIAPGQYLVGAYPVLERLFAEYREIPSKSQRLEKAADINLEHCLRYASMQASGAINVLKRCGFDNNEIVLLLQGGKKKLPKRLDPDRYDCQHAQVIYIHELLSQNSQLAVKAYMDKLYRTEQANRREAYFDRLEQDALPYQQIYQRYPM